MIERQPNRRFEPEITDIDSLVPKFHLLRKIERAMDWEKVYGLVEGLYNERIGRPSVDPVVLIKIVLLQHLYGIPSLRQTVRQCNENITYRWFLGYGLQERLPHFSTVSVNFLHRFSAEIFDEIFEMVLNQAIDSGYVRAEVIYVDSTHIKANANRKKQMKKYVPEAAKRYREELHRDINEDRELHGKTAFEDEDDDEGSPPAMKEVTVSTTDPESGLFHKGEHRVEFAYSAHTVCDDNNFILGFAVTAGNVHDSVMFDEVFKKAIARFPETETVAVDAGYKTPWICKQILETGRVPSMPYKRPMTAKGFFKSNEFKYDRESDCVWCPEGQKLRYSTTNRDGYREFKSEPKICEQCPSRYKCTRNSKYQKTFTRHIWQEYIETAEAIRHTAHGKATYSRRSQTIERVFADAKEKHGMRYTNHRGLARVTSWVGLKYTAMNLKKLASWRCPTPPSSLLFPFFDALNPFSFFQAKAALSFS